MADSYLPSSDAGLLEWAANFASIIYISYASVGLTELQATDFDDAREEYAAALAVAQHANTRTRPNIEAKNLKKRAVVAKARVLVNIVQKYGPLTDVQRRALRINVPKHRSPQPAPIARPAMRIVSVVGRTVAVDIFDPTSATKRNKVAGAAAAWVYAFVGTSYPSDPTGWSFLGAANRTRFEFTLPNTVAAGAQIWICAAWINRKNEAGPTSLPLSTNVQGGGTGEQQASLKLAA